MKKILVIDDQKDNIIAIKAVIKNNLTNCKVMGTMSGKEGIEAAKREQPDVILLDIIMPKMDGFEVCSKLKADGSTKHIPIIMVTAIKTDSKSRVKGLNMGADAFISKPIDVSEFTAQVNVMLRIKEAEDKLRSERKILDQMVEQKTRRLNESEDKYRSLFVNMMNSFALHEIILDKKGKPVDYIFLEVNDAFVEQTGLKREDIIGKKVTEALPGIENDPGDWIGRYGKVALGEGEIRFEQYAEPLGKWYSVLAYSPKERTFATVFNDITKQKKAEEQIRTEKQFIDTALNAQDDTFFLFEVATGKPLKWNDSFRKISGYTDNEIEMMPALQSYYEGEDLVRATSFLQGLPKEGADTIELDLICKDGKKIPTEYRVSFLKDELQESKYIISIGRDITTHKQAVVKLKEQAVFVEQNPAPVFSVNYSGEILAINNSTQKISKDIRPGKQIYETFSELDSSLVNNLKDNKPIQFEVKIDTQYYLFNIIKSSETGVIYFFGMDITERNQTTIALLDSEYLLSESQQVAQIGSYVLDISNDSWIGSEYLDVIFGIKKNHPKNTESWIGLIHPDDQAMMVSYFQENILKNQEPFNKEYRIINQITKDVTWVHGLGKLDVNKDGDPAKMIGVIQDISLRKESEKKLKKSEERIAQVIQHSQEWIWEVNENGLYTYASPVLEDLLGYSSEEIVGKKHFFDLFHPEDREELKNAALAAFQQKQPFKEFINRNINKKGETVWLSTSGIPMLDDKGNLEGYRGADTNITERKNAELELLESQEKLELLFSQSLDGFFFMMLDKPIEWNEQTEKDKTMNYVFAHHRITKFNDAILEQYNATKDQYMGLTPNDFFEHDIDHGKEVWRKFFDAGKLRVETNERKMDGTHMVIEGDYTCMYDSDNRIIGHFGIQRDITDQKEAADALQDSERKYKDLFEKSDDAVLIISENFFIDCNMATVRMLRYKNKEDLLDTHPSQLSPEKQPDGRLSFEKAEEMINLALKKGSHRFEWNHKKSDGEVFPVEVLLTAITNSVGKKIIHTVWRDITNRKRSEQIQKTLYNISNASISSDNIENLINLIQKELSTIIDTTNFYIALYNPESDTISLPFMADEKDKFETFPAGKTLTYYVIKTQKSLLATKDKLKELESSGEVESFGSDSEIWLGVPLKAEGKVTGVLAVQSYTDEFAYNISDMEILEFVSEQISISIDRKKAEQDLKTALHQATESDRLKSTFLATMSHELRTPLNAIIGFSSLVDNKTDIDKIIQYNNTIHSSGNHLLNIVEDLFDITLIEAGESKLKKTRVNLNDILNDIHEITKAEQENLNKPNLNLKLIFDSSDQEIMFYTDPAKLKQILINLLKNALKFTHEGYVHFGYKIDEDKPKKSIEFFVKDTGIGIPEEKQKLIFDVFARLEDAHSATYGGTGIGLSIARRLTEMLGGTIWLVSDSKPDSLFRGSTFYFTLPYEEAEYLDEIKVSKEVELVGPTTSTGEYILIVEDDEYSFEFLKIVLEKPGTSIFRATDGEEAIKFCEENPDTDLVLMDINLPTMNGFEATKRIKKFRPQLPIIAQTAYAISGDREKALAAGCEDYISKPIKKDELIEKINKLLNVK